MTAIIVPASEFARRREEREKQRRGLNFFTGSILGDPDDKEEDQPRAPASPARTKETRP